MTEWWQAARVNPLFRLVVMIGVAVIAVDQATKLWVLHSLDLDRDCLRNLDGVMLSCPNRQIDLSPIFDISYVENRGVSFGLLAGGMASRVLLTLLALGVAGFVLHWAGRLDRRWAAIGAGLIVGGAFGNAIDRSLYGFVVDFLDFSGLGFPWVFNIADAAINVGVACLAYDAVFVSAKKTAMVSGGGTSANLTADEPGEREKDEPFPDGPSQPIRPEDQNSRSSE